MSAASIPEVEALPEQSPDDRTEVYRPSRPRPERVAFTAGQQRVLDREISKAKRKFGERFQHAAADIRELVWACEQLLYKKLSQEQAQDIAAGVMEIKAEYVEARECRKTQ